MFAKKDPRAVCAHEKTVTVRTAGIERTVCEKCGMVSFQSLEGLSGRVDRSQFMRDSERTHVAVV
ncbi:MAG: hypothetical protein PVJ28_03345 [Acidimicrobiia bacterium]